jgi:hypothetical protein
MHRKLGPEHHGWRCAHHERQLLAHHYLSGLGHVLYLHSEVTENRWRIYSDNIAMARWLQLTVQAMLNAATTDRTIPVTEAQFSKSGDPRYFWIEHVVARDEDISLTWYDIDEPLLIHTQPHADPGAWCPSVAKQHQSDGSGVAGAA